MSWGVRLNRPHVLLWRRWLCLWLGFVAFGLAVGPKARPDEIAFVTLLPLGVLALYAAGNLALVWLRALGQRYWWHFRWPRLLLRGDGSDSRTRRVERRL